MELTNGKNNLFFSHGQDAENKYYHSVYIYNDISSLYLLSEKIPPNSVVIDLACGSGKLGFVINNEKKPCELYGVEMDVTAAKCAAEPGFYKNIFIFDLTNYECIEYSKMLQVVASPDVIVMSDILEHLADPTVVLLHYLKILKEDGIILISVPNVAHADIGLGLLEGKFNYTQMGILDNTHLKFFTRSSFFEWIELIKKQYSINIQCEFLGTTVIDTDYLNSIRLNHSELFESLILNPDFNALQLLFLIRKANDETDKDNIGNNDFRKPMESIVETISGKLKGFNPLAGNNEIGKISDNERLMYEKRITALYTNQNNRVLSFTNQVKRLEDNIQNTKTTLTQRNEQIKELKDKKNALSSNVSRLENIITIRNERIDALLAYVSQLENTVKDTQATLTQRDERINALLAYVSQLENKITVRDERINALLAYVSQLENKITVRDERIDALLAYVSQLENTVKDTQATLTQRDERIDALLAYVSQLENTVNEIQNTSLWKLFIKRIINR